MTQYGSFQTYLRIEKDEIQLHKSERQLHNGSDNLSDMYTRTADPEFKQRSEHQAFVDHGTDSKAYNDKGGILASFSTAYNYRATNEKWDISNSSDSYQGYFP